MLTGRASGSPVGPHADPNPLGEWLFDADDVDEEPVPLLAKQAGGVDLTWPSAKALVRGDSCCAVVPL